MLKAENWRGWQPPAAAAAGAVGKEVYQRSGHSDVLMAGLNELRRSSALLDVVLRTANNGGGVHELSCHRLVLAACSPYFAAMFSGGLRESRQAHVDLGDSVDPQVLEQLVGFAYTGRVELAEESAAQLLSAADMLQFGDVREACAAFLCRCISPDSCLSLLALADAHACARLRTLALQACLESFEQACQDHQFPLLSADVIAELLSSDELEATEETHVMQALARWAQHDSDARRPHLPRLLRCVRLGLLSKEFLSATLNGGDGGVFSGEPPCRIALEEALAWRRSSMQSSELGTMAHPRRNSLTMFLIAGKTFASDMLFSVSRHTGSLTPRRSLPRQLKQSSACAMGQRILVTGGRAQAVLTEGGRAPAGVCQAERATWVYDTAEDEWSPGPTLGLTRYAHASTELDGRVYVAGGYTVVTAVFPMSMSEPLKEVECLHSGASEWKPVAPMPHGLSYLAMAGSKGKLYVFGETEFVPPAVQRYCPASRSWSVIGPCPLRCRFSAAAALGPDVYVVGGEGSREVRRFDCAAHRWWRAAPMASARTSPAAVAAAGRVYVAGGYNGTSRSADMECYCPRGDTWAPAGGTPGLCVTALVCVPAGGT
ncbi:kelch-like protein 25 isoform X2 [Petromyzon marinus]|nr:kelch-like protein 25 isoform X2 [Petromyzon marinus]XP_032829813.1 kelch-like protein 25 isoform X2 [Petromyzon marinus]XP_032829814.1 kelch-like protein 25 isoform X2 [Petromyzon marinus]XP_032829815.1 kelch-like protein 25 isoform X2 [Petromyzon marinus]XP_032829816.1 kelch-like protein 25 isoform X2 [Petromyzon marinus]